MAGDRLRESGWEATTVPKPKADTPEYQRVFPLMQVFDCFRLMPQCMRWQFTKTVFVKV